MRILQASVGSFAEVARHFITLNRNGILATQSVSNEGYPFGSLTPYLIAADGSIVIYISLISEHYKNLEADSRASLTIADPFGFEDPQSHARATVLLDFKSVTASEVPLVQEQFLQRFPKAVNHQIAHNFLYLRASIRKIRWIAGFGSMGWVSGDELRNASVDPIVAQGFDILSHMNADHRDSLVELVAKEIGEKLAPASVLMTNISSEGFVISVRGKKPQSVVCSFSTSVTNAEEARRAIIELLKGARST